MQEGGENEHSDEMLRRWINRCLIPPRYNPEALEAQVPMFLRERMLFSVVVSNFFVFTPKFGEMIQFDKRAYFSKGLVNQPPTIDV